jgi:hypothetical protein
MFVQISSISANGGTNMVQNLIGPIAYVQISSICLDLIHFCSSHLFYQISSACADFISLCFYNGVEGIQTLELFHQKFEKERSQYQSFPRRRLQVQQACVLFRFYGFVQSLENSF